MRSSAHLLLLFPLLPLLAAACSTTSDAVVAPTIDASDETRTFGGARPVTVRVPEGYDASHPAPLVMMLHGYGSAGLLTDFYWPMSHIADAKGFFYVTPNGLFDKDDKRYWNATDACCDFANSGVDDVAYLTGLVAEIQSAYAIDPKRIYVMGHSNGGYMAHRLACEHADTFAAIVSFAGAVWKDPAKCAASAPVGVLQIHGTVDDEVPYAGRTTGRIIPGAEETIADWATKNGCAPDLVDTQRRLHVSADGTGQETIDLAHSGCAQNGAAELWRVEGAAHLFAYTPESLEAIWSFVSTHAKP